MFDFSFLELFLVGLIVLLVVGPERLPGLLRTVGLWVGRARAVVASLRTEMEREVNRSGLRDTERALREQTTEAKRQLREVGSDVGEATGRTEEIGTDTTAGTDASDGGPSEPAAPEAPASNEHPGAEAPRDRDSS